MPETFPSSLLSLADSLIPPLKSTVSISALICSNSNSYVVKLRSSFLSEYRKSLLDFPAHTLELKTYVDLKNYFDSLDYPPEFVSKFISCFSELLFDACLSSPDILSSLKL